MTTQQETAISETTAAALRSIKAEGYEAQAVLTKSDAWHGELVPRVEFESAINRAVEALSDLDRIKKSLFYGKPYEVDPSQVANPDVFVNCLSAPHFFGVLTRQTGVDVLHGIIGAATEAGELLEVVQKCLRDPSHFDLVNVREEVFDAQWYHAILAKALGFTFQAGQRNNIAKLRKRFPNRFTEHDANNRNLDVERVVLEAVGGCTDAALMGETAFDAVTPVSDIKTDLQLLHDAAIAAAAAGFGIGAETVEFLAWLTTRRAAVTFSAAHTVPDIGALVDEFNKQRSEKPAFEKAA